MPVPVLRLAVLHLFLLALASLLLGACSTATSQTVPQTVDAFADETAFNGVLLVADDTHTYLCTYGDADVKTGTATHRDSRYQLGSISKWVSTLVVLRLVDDGVLTLHAPVGDVLAGLPSTVGQRVTLHHLITHTSGVPNQIMAAFESDPSVMTTPLTTLEAVRRYASGSLQFDPGSQFDYSHSNWILVQAIVETATGMPFSDVVRERLAMPLGLENTGAFGGDFDAVPDIAASYTALGPDPERAPAVFPLYLTAAGGLYSTGPDLLALLNGLYGGGLLSDASLDALDTVYVEDEMYAYGGRVRTMDVGGEPTTVIWHTGSNGPSKSRVSRVLSTGLTVITLSNTGASSDDTGAFTERVIAASGW